MTTEALAPSAAKPAGGGGEIVLPQVIVRRGPRLRRKDAAGRVDGHPIRRGGGRGRR